MADLELLVTGSGRCGTQYMATVLTEAGMACGHEVRYGYDGFRESPFPAESSWMAVPHLAEITCPVVLLVRSPLEVAASLVGFEFFTTPGPYLDFLLAHEPDLVDMAPAQAALRFWMRWNERAVDRADAILLTEELSTSSWPAALQKLVDVPDQLADVRDRTAPSNSRKRVSTDTLIRPETLADVLAADRLWQRLTADERVLR